VGEIRDELEGRQLPTGGKRKSSHYLYCQTHQMKDNRKGAKVIQGIMVNDLKISIYEMKKEYEVHVMFKKGLLNKDDIEKRMHGTIDYLAEEGYFDKKKKVKVIGMAFKGK
jgi:hypothetical protein